jgi:purine nucleosidase
VPRPFVIDTDTASDDAVALLVALRDPQVEVRAITVVGGNVPVEQGVQNALYTVEMAGAEAPVHAGVDGAVHNGKHVHGEDGMGDIGLDLHGREPASLDAVSVIVDEVRAAPGEVTLVTLGPLTNVAAAFERAPDVPRKLRALVVMGGTSDGIGNVTPVAEYNVWADIPSAAAVLAAGAPLTMVGWDVSRKYAVITPADMDELRTLGPLGAFSVDIQRTLVEFCRTQTKLDGFDLPDPITTAIAVDPSVATATRRARVTVDPETGQTMLVDAGEPRVDVVVEASRERFVALLRDALRG